MAGCQAVGAEEWNKEEAMSTFLKLLIIFGGGIGGAVVLVLAIQWICWLFPHELDEYKGRDWYE